jgi:hypothetical protein
MLSLVSQKSKQTFVKSWVGGWILESGDESPARGPRVGPNVLPVSSIDKKGERKKEKIENLA